MNIGLVNGSPKLQNSTTENILSELKSLLKEEKLYEFNFHKCEIDNNDKEKINNMDVLVFAFPLYVDSLPANLLSCLAILENEVISKAIKVYAICNCGFFEGEQCNIALDIMKNWSAKANLSWQEGIGIGGGGMLKGLKKDKGPRKSISLALRMLASDILVMKGKENRYVSPLFPRFLYKFCAEANWRKCIKANGLKKKDLFRKL